MRLIFSNLSLLLLYSQIKLWEVYGNRKLVRTYNGHKMPVKDIYFNNDGTEFLSTSFDKFVKLWDTETGLFLYFFFFRISLGCFRSSEKPFQYRSSSTLCKV